MLFRSPVATERFARLRSLEEEAGEGPVAVEGVLRALIEPALRMAHDPELGGAAMVRLFGRTIVEPNETVQKLLGEEFGATYGRFSTVFARALPGMPESVLMWRIQFVIGAMAHLMCDPGKLKEASAGRCDPGDTEQAAREMVTFLSAGLRAPWEVGLVDRKGEGV